MFENSLSQGTLLKSLTEALITLLLKPDKEATKYNSYQPISLLNAVVNIQAEISDLPLVNMIPTNQASFIKDWFHSLMLSCSGCPLHSLS